jgi:hypothetical protein
MIRDVACEAINFPDDEDLNAALLGAAKVHEFQELGAVREFGRFSLLHKYLKN